MKRQAKYYIYRNLHTGTFSVRYKGKVIAHPVDLMAFDIDFVVNQKGRDRVLLERKKYVHAFVACKDWYPVTGLANQWKPQTTNKEVIQVNYNPYHSSSFNYNDAQGCNHTVNKCEYARMVDGKIYTTLAQVEG